VVAGKQAAHFTDKQLSTIPAKAFLVAVWKPFIFAPEKGRWPLLDGVKHDEFPRVGVTR
jgi:hypothetical protein